MTLTGRLVELIPRCRGCDRFWWPLADERWKAYLTETHPAELVFCCPDCDERDSG